jgi:phospholysine phosphohistidine inorganic pyrophosphate phosphatase
MSAILFDLDGVLYEGEKPIDGAADAVNWFHKNHIPLLFLTNTTSKSRVELVAKLADFGIDSEADDFLTPPVAACQWLQLNNLVNILAFVPASTKEEFSAFNIMDNDAEKYSVNIDAVIVGDLGEQWSFEILNKIFRALINNPEAKLIALGMTRYWKNNSVLQLDVGPMIKAFEYATGLNAIVTGKPAKEFFLAASNLLGESIRIKNTVMIGDDIRGDIEASQQAGFKAIQVRTGKFSASDLKLGITPDVILDSVADLPQWWRSNK